MREAVRRARPPLEVFADRLHGALTAFGRLGLLVACLLPLLATAFLTLDLPVAAFDIFPIEEDFLNPSAWLTQGQVWMTFTFFVISMASRRFGDNYAAAQVMISWGLFAGLLAAGLSYLAPALEASDMPPTRFVVAFAASWMTGQFVCLLVFELTRAVKWWRAPLYGTLIGAAAQCLIYFPFLYWGSRLPWVNWMITDYAIKAGFAFAFLIPYAMLRKAIPPGPGLGGK